MFNPRPSPHSPFHCSFFPVHEQGRLGTEARCDLVSGPQTLSQERGGYVIIIIRSWKVVCGPEIKV